MLEPMIPRPEQEAAIQQVLEHKAHISKADKGAGKTLIGVEAALRSKAKVTLIIAPLNTLKGWRTTTERQSQGTVDFRQIKAGKQGQDNFAELVYGTPGVYFIGWEYFRGFSWKGFHVDFIIADEGHRMQNRKSKTATAINDTIKTEYKLYLSATPAGNNIEGLWQGIKWLWPKQTPAYWAWVTEWMKTEKDPYTYKRVAGERNPGALWASLPSKSSFKSPYQEKPIIHLIEVELSAAQRKHYDRFEEDAITWLEEHPLVATLPAVKHIRLRQMCLAVPSIKIEERWDDDEQDYVPTELVYYEDNAKSSKIDATLELLTDLYAESTYPVLMFTHSRKFATLLTKRLQAKKYRARQFVGGMSPEERAWKLDNFGVEFDILVATISTIGEGTDGLQLVCDTEIWYSRDDDRVKNIQAKGRLSRPGQEKPVNRYIIQAADTIEVRQAGRIEADQALLDESLEEKEMVTV